MRNLIFLAFISLFLVACGGGGSSGGGNNTAPLMADLSYVEVNEQIFNGDREVVGILSDGTETLTIIKNPNIDTISELYYNSGNATETALVYTINSGGLPSRVSAQDGTYIEFNYPTLDASPTTLRFYNSDNNLVYETTATIDISAIKQTYNDLINTQSSIALSPINIILDKGLNQVQQTTSTCYHKGVPYNCSSAQPIEISSQTSKYIDYGITVVGAVFSGIEVATNPSPAAKALAAVDLIRLKTRLVVGSVTGDDINNTPIFSAVEDISNGISDISCASDIIVGKLSGCATQFLKVFKDKIFVVSPPTEPDPATDTTPPVITLNGDNPLNLSIDDTYTELGATANDDVDGSVTVGISGNVDTSTAGTYEITYTAVDSTGNESTTTRTVNISRYYLLSLIETTNNITRLEDDIFNYYLQFEFLNARDFTDNLLVDLAIDSTHCSTHLGVYPDIVVLEPVCNLPSVDLFESCTISNDILNGTFVSSVHNIDFENVTTNTGSWEIRLDGAEAGLLIDGSIPINYPLCTGTARLMPF